MISYGKQSIDKKDIDSVVKVLKSPFLTQGPTIKKFEDALARYTSAKYAIALVNGTAALHAACFAAGISPGDEVIVPCMSFVASANCVLYCGATPVLVDVYDETLTLDVEKAEKKITKKTKAIIAVDFAGHPAEWDKLKKLSKKYELALIDDASHALGSKYKNRPIGSVADLTTFSFHPVKTITTGEGGMVVTNNKKFYEAIKTFRNQGILQNKSIQNKKGQWYYDVVELGFNFRMTEIQAALGLSQLKKLNGFIAKRRQIKNIYENELENVGGISVPMEKKGNFSSWHLYQIRVNQRLYGQTRGRLYAKLQKEDVHVQVHYVPISFHKLYRKSLGYKVGDFPVAERFYKQTLSLPLYPTLSDSDQKKVIRLIKKR